MISLGQETINIQDILDAKEKVYIDTCIIIDILKNRKIESIQILEKFKKASIELFSSYMALLEFLNYLKEEHYIFEGIRDGKDIRDLIYSRQYKDLTTSDFSKINKKYEAFILHFNNLKMLQIDQEILAYAFNIFSNTNLDTNDSIHLSCAIKGGCTVLITSDDFFAKEAKYFLDCNKISLLIFKPEQII